MRYHIIRNTPITDQETRRTMEELSKHGRVLVNWEGSGDEFRMPAKGGVSCTVRKLCTFHTKHGKRKILVVALDSERHGEYFAI